MPTVRPQDISVSAGGAIGLCSPRWRSAADDKPTRATDRACYLARARRHRARRERKNAVFAWLSGKRPINARIRAQVNVLRSGSLVPFLITPSTSTRSVRSIRRVPLSRAKIHSGPSRSRGLRFRRGPASRRGLGDAAFSRQFQVECSLNVRYHPIRTQPVVRRGVLALVTSLGRYHHVLARAGEAGRFGAAVVGVG